MGHPLSFKSRISTARSIFERNSETWLYALMGLLYLLGVWAHANGNIYTDLSGVFINRFCTPEPCATTGLPYVNYFVEYPPITGFFIFTMGVLGHALPFPGRPLLTSYYDYSSIFLLFPTLLLISNLLKIANLLGLKRNYRTLLLYLIATPSFVFMLLLNWYIIGVSLTAWGMRKFLETTNSGVEKTPRRTKSMFSSGILLGLSACANLVTAVPALGILIYGTNQFRERVYFALGIASAVLSIYVPLIVVNSFPHSYLNAQHVIINYTLVFPNLNVIVDFAKYEQSWYAEGSWMIAFFSSTDPVRHYVFPAFFFALSAAIVFKIRRMIGNNRTVDRRWLTVATGGLFTFAFLFSTYVCTPQMNLILLPFFVLFPFLRRNYWEFISFEVVNSLVIVWGFSTPISLLGFTIPAPVAFGSPWMSPIQFLAVVRSLWIGKFLIYDGLIKWKQMSSIPRSEARPSVMIPVAIEEPSIDISG